MFADIERQDRYAVLAAISGILVTMLWRANPSRFAMTFLRRSIEILLSSNAPEFPFKTKTTLNDRSLLRVVSWFWLSFTGSFHCFDI